MRRPLVLASLALLAACRSAASPDGGRATPEGAVVARVTAPDTLRLGVGESGAVDGGRVVVQFRRLEGDSRCPRSVRCAWQGDAAAELRLVAGGRRAGTTLHTTLEPRAIEYDGYDLALVRVDPYPETPAPVDSSKYAVVVRVSRH